jgi:hypothetical protein
MNHDPCFRINAPHIVHEIFEDHEAAIINLKSGNYYSLDPVGAFVWAHLERGASTGEIVEEILAHYDGESGDVTRELVRFLDALQAEELIVSQSEPAPGPEQERVKPAANGNGSKVPFTPPIVERYNDMQELLLLDPIHEVDETGWPNRKRED